jgi:hypothetical protein
MVEAVRLGTIIAFNPKAHGRWKTMQQRQAIASSNTAGLSGASLEQAVMALHVAHPEYVAFGARA